MKLNKKRQKNVCDGCKHRVGCIESSRQVQCTDYKPKNTAKSYIAKFILIFLVATLSLTSTVHAKKKPKMKMWTSFKVTAYCDCKKCCGKSDGVTATGTIAKEGRTIAVDPNKIPYGSTVLVYHKKELVGIYIAEDCGGAIKGKKLDIFFDKHSDARKWGIKKCRVVVLKGIG